MLLFLCGFSGLGGCVPADHWPHQHISQLLPAAVTAAAVESLPLPDADNVLVPAAAAAVGLWCFGLPG